MPSTRAAHVPGTRGYVGGTTDPTGLVHLGAREYDPTLGQFLSVDPINDTDDPAQMKVSLSSREWWEVRSLWWRLRSLPSVRPPCWGA